MRSNILSVVFLVLILLPAIGRGAATTGDSGELRRPDGVSGKPPETFLDIRTRIGAEISARQDEFRLLMDSRRNDFTGRFSTAREDFNARLMSVKDDRRRQLALRVSDKMQDILKNAIDRFTDTANAFDGVFGQLEIWHDQAVAAGLPMESVEPSMNAAQTAIATARADIAGLLTKTYLIAVTGDTTLKVDAAAARDIMKNDFIVVREDLRTVRDALRTALQAFERVHGIHDIFDPLSGVATSTASSTTLSASSTNATSP